MGCTCSVARGALLRFAGTIALLLVATASHAALPRGIARAFLDSGIPLNAVGVVVQDVRQVRPLFVQQPRKAMSPASVMKLVTTYAALDLLGRDYRWRTEAYADGTIEGGVLKGNLVLKGYGDPKITIEQWQALMGALRARGIERIEGDLVLDRSYFAVGPHDPSAFDAAPLRPYNVGPDALLVNFKSVRFSFAPDAADRGTQIVVEPPLAAVRVARAPALTHEGCDDWRARLLAGIDDRGAQADVDFAGTYAASCGERSLYVALLDHSAYVHAMFRTYFTAAGGTFSGAWRDGRAPRNATPVAVLESPPLYDVVRDVNKLSNNVMARQLFLTLATTAAPPPATPAGAEAAVRQWLRAKKLAMPELVIENGSGLSRRERVSPGGLARLLVAAQRSPVGQEFASSLPVAATDGTLERRFLNDAVGGQALLKTGTLEGVRAIAGYVLDPSGHTWALVAIVNHPQAGQAQPALDFLVEWVYRNAAAWAQLH